MVGDIFVQNLPKGEKFKIDSDRFILISPRVTWSGGCWGDEGEKGAKLSCALRVASRVGTRFN